jgi:salicylate hydroxylase
MTEEGSMLMSLLELMVSFLF